MLGRQLTTTAPQPFIRSPLMLIPIMGILTLVTVTAITIMGARGRFSGLRSILTFTGIVDFVISALTEALASRIGMVSLTTLALQTTPARFAPPVSAGDHSRSRATGGPS